MSFGPKLDHLSAACLPGTEVVVTLEFVPEDEEFERHFTIYVEEAAGIRLMKVRVQSATQGPAS